MTDTNPLPPLPEPEGVIVVGTQALRAFTAYQMRAYALQARAQVQGEPFGYIHHFVAHDDSGVIIDTTWEADGCADAMPHPTRPAAWEWSHATPFYTTPQPAHATQADVTDSMIREAFLTNGFTIKDGHSDLKPYVYAAARAILALRPVQVPMTDDVVRDAERYRWLRDHGTVGFSSGPAWQVCVSFNSFDASAQTLDANIDAAIAASQAQKGGE